MPLETSRREIKRKKIVSAALKVMGEQGYRDATVRDITDEAGVACGIFYYYFESKPDLVEKMIKEGTALILDAYERATMLGMSAGEMFQTIAGVTYDEVLTYPEFIKFAFSERWYQHEDWRLVLGEELDEIVMVFAAIIEHGQDEGIFDGSLNASGVAHMVFSTICTTAAANHEGHVEEDNACTREQVVEFVYRGLACRGVASSAKS